MGLIFYDSQVSPGVGAKSVAVADDLVGVRHAIRSGAVPSEPRDIERVRPGLVRPGRYIDEEAGGGVEGVDPEAVKEVRADGVVKGNRRRDSPERVH